jgi:hypothetical protein
VPYAEVKDLAAMDGDCEAMEINNPRNSPASEKKAHCGTSVGAFMQTGSATDM